MNHPRMTYFEKDDVLHLSISSEKEAGSVEIAPNVTVELNDKGELIGVEILEASRFTACCWDPPDRDSSPFSHGNHG